MHSFIAAAMAPGASTKRRKLARGDGSGAGPGEANGGAHEVEAGGRASAADNVGDDEVMGEGGDGEGQGDVFHLQLAELLREVRDGDGRKAFAEGLVRKLAEECAREDASLPASLSAATFQAEQQQRQGAHSSPPPASFFSALSLQGDGPNESIVPSAPDAMQVVGSFSVGTSELPVSDVDVAVSMPWETFTPKDFLNHRYFGKRALYLTYLVSKIFRVKELARSVQYEWLNNDPLKPVAVSTVEFKGKSLRIRFIPCLGGADWADEAADEDAAEGDGASACVFEMHKLHPLRNNIRGCAETIPLPANWRKPAKAGEAPQRQPATHDENDEPVTPNYSAAIVGECSAPPLPSRDPLRHSNPALSLSPSLSLSPEKFGKGH